MDYKELIKNHDFSSHAKVVDWIWNATCAITDLLARCERLNEARENANEACAKLEYRAKTAEERCKMLEDSNRILFGRITSAETKLEAVYKMVQEYQDVIVHEYRERSEKAERERDVLSKELKNTEGVRSASICQWLMLANSKACALLVKNLAIAKSAWTIIYGNGVG